MKDSQMQLLKKFPKSSINTGSSLYKLYELQMVTLHEVHEHLLEVQNESKVKVEMGLSQI